MNIVGVFICVLAVLHHSAESSSELTCNSTLLPNGSVHFQLSQGPSSSSCSTYWEDHNRTVIARDKDFDRELVRNLENDSITLADCRHLRYNLECSGVLQEIKCPVNCSHVDPDPSSNPLNSTGPDKLAVIIIITAAVVVLVIVVPWFWHKKKCSSYTPTPQTA